MIAFVRAVSPRLDRCELTYVKRGPIDAKLAEKQHTQLVAQLEQLAVSVEFVSALPDHPDGVFIEDTAVLLPEVAIVARSGVASRLAETSSILGTLGQHR